MIRHLRSLRRLERDHGWIHTLLEEAENERMHLMTFMTLLRPGPIFRGAIIVTQYVFTVLFSLAYMVSPHFCHRYKNRTVLNSSIIYIFLPASKTCAGQEEAMSLGLLITISSIHSNANFIQDQLTLVNPFAIEDPIAMVGFIPWMDPITIVDCIILRAFDAGQ